MIDSGSAPPLTPEFDAASQDLQSLGLVVDSHGSKSPPMKWAVKPKRKKIPLNWQIAFFWAYQDLIRVSRLQQSASSGGELCSGDLQSEQPDGE